MTNLIERHLKVPKYLRLAEELRARIADETLRAGDRLPSFKEMRAQCGASQKTVERVYGLLEQKA